MGIQSCAVVGGMNAKSKLAKICIAQAWGKATLLTHLLMLLHELSHEVFMLV